MFNYFCIKVDYFLKKIITGLFLSCIQYISQVVEIIRVYFYCKISSKTYFIINKIISYQFSQHICYIVVLQCTSLLNFLLKISYLANLLLYDATGR